MMDLVHIDCSLGHWLRTKQQAHANAGQLPNLLQRNNCYPERHIQAGHILHRPAGHRTAVDTVDHCHILPVLLALEQKNILGLLLALAPWDHSIAWTDVWWNHGTPL